MARPDKISRYLPICFPNGTKVRRFAKHCPHCHAMVSADAMLGIACLLDNKIFVSARSLCPACKKRFSIACVITDDRHVHRVLIPDWMFGLWLRLAVRDLPQPEHGREWDLAEDTPVAAPGLMVSDSEPITSSEDILGQFDGLKIFSWIEYQGQRYNFARAAPPGGTRLTEGDLLFGGRLIYHRSPSQPV
jgi:hypothetical protein